MKKYINAALLLFIATSLSSCLKNKYDALNPDGSPSVVEFKNPQFISPASPAGSLYSVYVESYSVNAAGADATYTVQLSGANPASQDITVTVGPDLDAVAKFNADQKAKNPNFISYDAPAITLYSFPKTTYVIPAGQRSVNITVNYKTALFDFSKKYAFPIAIKTTSTGSVSGNFGTILMNVSAKNAYDGIYAYSGTFFRNTATGPDLALGGTLVAGLTRPLATTAATSVSFAPLFATGGAVAGIDGTFLTVDPATNLVTAASSTNATLKNTPGAVNKYDPATKTFTIAFQWGDFPNDRAITAVLKYTGSR